MKECSARNILKRWSKNIMNKINNEDDTKYYIYNNFIIRAFSTILLYKSRGSYINKELFKKDILNKDFVWNRVCEIFNLNYYKKFKLEEVDNLFFDDVMIFAVEFCENNYQYLDNILAWLYQYLNINRTDNSNKDTQFFTDQYMVNYLVKNSLEMIEKDKLRKLKIIDPACGGGNFLVKIIEDIFLYTKLDKHEFIELVSNNIVGYDIDRTLSIITVINIYIKLIELNVIDEIEIFNYDLNIYYDINNKLGALLKEEDAKKKNIIKVTSGLQEKYTDVFSHKFDLLITNPPFKGSREQDKDIREYINSNYLCSKGDICNAFIERLYDLVELNGIASFVTQNGWMYLESYKDLRRKLLMQGSLDTIVDLGSNSFYDLNGEKTNISLIIYINNTKKESLNIYGLKEYSYNDKVNNIDLNSRVNILKYKDILMDDNFRIDYISKGKIKDAFKALPLYKEFGVPMQGTSTGDNKNFVAYHWEHQDENWRLVSKGGGYCKWTGLNIYKVNWGNDGEIVKSNPKSVMRNVQYFDSTDLVYSDTGMLGLSVRLLREDQIFIASGPGIRIKKGNKYCHLAFLNSRIASFYIKILTPKLTISATYISQIPVAEGIIESHELERLSYRTTTLKDIYNKKRPINYEYITDDYLKYNSIYLYAKKDFIDDLEIELERLEIEYRINELILSKYEFSESEINTVNSIVGVSPYLIDNGDITINHKDLDKLIVKTLNNNCYIKSGNKSKNSLGAEGILEYMAINYGMNPRKLFRYIIDNIEFYKLTIIHYYKHTLHRLKLNRTGYLRQNDYKYNDQIIKDIINKDIQNYNLKINIDNWFNEEVYKWHFDSFLKKPFIKHGEYENGK